jgi:hypothetical protein
MLTPCVLVVALVLAETTGQPTFTIHTSTAGPRTGHIDALAADGKLSLGTSTIAAGTLVSLRRMDVPMPPGPSEPHLLLANGDRVPGKIDRIDGETVRFLPAWQGDVPKEARLLIPLSAIAVLWYEPGALAGLDPLDRAWLTETRTRDVVLLRNGDKITGTLTGGSADGRQLWLEANKIDVQRVAAVAGNTALLRRPKLKAAYARVVLRNGGRVSLTSATADELAVVGKPWFGGQVRIPWAEVVAYDVLLGPATYLHELTPTQYEQRPFSASQLPPWPLGKATSVGGRPLRLRTPLGSSTFDHGIGLHSFARVTYALDGAYSTFEATVGLHDHADAGHRGNVRVQVLVDQPPRPGADAVLTLANGPLLVRIDVKQAKTLTLLVDYGTGGDVQDHVDWGDARLIR